jgi:hypothetical protein
MKVWKKTYAFAFMVALLFIFTACTDAASFDMVNKENSAALDYLKQAQEDMESVHAVLKDPDLDLDDMDDEDADAEDATLDQMQSNLQKVTEYREGLEASIANASQMEVPELQELQDFAGSEIHCMQLMNDVLGEYAQAGNYVLMMLDISDKGNQVQFNNNDLASSFQGVSDYVAGILEQLDATEPPSFLQSFHSNLIGLFTELNDSAGYLLSAVAIGDPLKTNAGLYRFNILSRNVESAITNVNADIERRTGKLKEDIKSVKAMDEGLTKWLYENIERLEDMEGGEAK